MVSTCRDQAKVGTISSTAQHYGDWKDAYPFTDADLVDMPKWELMLSKSVQLLLLIATISMPASGLMMNIGGGRATEVFGVQLMAAFEKTEWLSDAGHFIHVQSVNIVIFLLILHVVGALKHQFIAKDGTLSRMLGR